MEKIGNVEVLPSILSDHAPIVFSFDVKIYSQSPRWTLKRAILLKPEVISILKSKTADYFQLNTGSATLENIWDAYKAYIRGWVHGLTCTKNKEELQELQDMERKIKNLETDRVGCPSEKYDSICKDLEDCQIKYKYMLDQKVKAQWLTHNMQNFEYGEKAGALLAWKARMDRARNNVNELLIDENGNSSSNPEIIQSCFYNQFADLYREENTATIDSIRSWLGDRDLPVLTEEGRSCLDDPITELEIELTIKGIKNNKAAGTDAIPGELYKSLQEELVPNLCELFNYVYNSGGKIPHSWGEAIIVLILKPGKDPRRADSYRPISLLNADYKIFMSILAGRLVKLMPKLINSDQKGFIPDRYIQEHVLQLIGTIDLATTLSRPLAVAAYDAAKAFDRVSWPFLWEVLAKMGFSQTFIQLLVKCYRGASAAILVNGLLSARFTISRGTRQGCPISPLLFDLYIEPLAQALRQEVLITSINIHQYNPKLALYADDLLLYTDDPVAVLPRVEDLLKEFGVYSGYSVNPSKTEVMCWNVDDWVGPLSKEFKYLGVVITNDIMEIPNVNIKKVLRGINRLFTKWKNLPLTIYGRVNLVKMIIVPKLTYLFSTIPLDFPDKLINKVQGNIGSFIWGNKSSRLSWKKLRRRLLKGGLALPDIAWYAAAFQFKNIRMLMATTVESSWGRLLHAMCIVEGSGDGFLYKFGAPRFFKKVRLKVLRTALNVWYKARRKWGIGYYSEFAPIWDSPGTPLCMQDSLAQPIRRAGIQVWADLITSEGVLPWEVLKLKIGQSLSRFKYLQLVSWYTAEKDFISSNWDIEHRCQNPISKKREISFWYNSLLAADVAGLPPLETVWSQSLLNSFAAELIYISLQTLYKFVKSASLKKNHFYVINRLYYTPAKIAKFASSVSSNCPRCGNVQADDVHMFFECPILLGFWDGVGRALEAIFGQRINLNLGIVFFGLDQDILGSYLPNQRGLLLYLIIIARREICKVWKNPLPPLYNNWVRAASIMAQYDRDSRENNNSGTWSQFLVWYHGTC